MADLEQCHNHKLLKINNYGCLIIKDKGNFCVFIGVRKSSNLFGLEDLFDDYVGKKVDLIHRVTKKYSLIPYLKGNYQTWNKLWWFGKCFDKTGDLTSLDGIILKDLKHYIRWARITAYKLKTFDKKIIAKKRILTKQSEVKLRNSKVCWIKTRDFWKVKLDVQSTPKARDFYLSTIQKGIILGYINPEGILL
jgi:hypothetical protein